MAAARSQADAGCAGPESLFPLQIAPMAHRGPQRGGGGHAAVASVMVPDDLLRVSKHGRRLGEIARLAREDERRHGMARHVRRQPDSDDLGAVGPGAREGAVGLAAMRQEKSVLHTLRRGLAGPDVWALLDPQEGHVPRSVDVDPRAEDRGISIAQRHDDGLLVLHLAAGKAQVDSAGAQPTHRRRSIARFHKARGEQVPRANGSEHLAGERRRRRMHAQALDLGIASPAVRRGGEQRFGLRRDQLRGPHQPRGGGGRFLDQLAEGLDLGNHPVLAGRSDEGAPLATQKFDLEQPPLVRDAVARLPARTFITA